MIIYFLRHANAGQSLRDPVRDEKRGLDREGISQCRDMGRVLAALDVQVDAVVSSPLKRSTQTASLVGSEMGFEGKIEMDPALRPTASYASFRDLLKKHQLDEAIMVVGHNPTLSEFLSLLLTDGASDSIVDLKKGAVARVELLGKRRTTLRWCLTPRMVRAIYDSSTASSLPKTSRK